MGRCADDARQQVKGQPEGHNAAGEGAVTERNGKGRVREGGVGRTGTTGKGFGAAAPSLSKGQCGGPTYSRQEQLPLQVFGEVTVYFVHSYVDLCDVNRKKTRNGIKLRKVERNIQHRQAVSLFLASKGGRKRSAQWRRKDAYIGRVESCRSGQLAFRGSARVCVVPG